MRDHMSRVLSSHSSISSCLFLLLYFCALRTPRHLASLFQRVLRTMSPSKIPSITNGVNGHDLWADYPDTEPQTGPYRVLEQYHSKRTRLRVASIGAGASGNEPNSLHENAAEQVRTMSCLQDGEDVAAGHVGLDTIRKEPAPWRDVV